MRNPTWLRLLAAAAATAAVLSACGGGSEKMEAGPPAPTSPVTVGVERVFAGLGNFSSPIAMLQAPSDGTRWFVVEQGGRVQVFANTPNVASATTFIDIGGRVASGGELGLLGMAFHPGFPADHRVYLSYTNQSSGLVSRISEFTTSDNGATLDPASEQILLTIDQPESNHNGGGISFGADGFLYIGMGDGGGSNDQHGTIGNGQLMTTLLGKMLRIDVDGTSAGFRYRIPTDNPYAGNALCGTNGTGSQNCPEIYASGLRNPWRWSFDRQTGQMWVADVGQDMLEEVDRIAKGGNYGWRCMEATRNTGLPCGSAQTFVAPVAEYGRTMGNSVTGGYVYRGSAIPGLVGHYVFGDYGSGRIWHIPADTAPTLTISGGFESGLSIASFAQDKEGELYVLHYPGQIYKITGS